MSKQQIKTIRGLFKEIKEYKEKSKSAIDSYNQWASEKYHDLFGYIIALYQLDIISEKQYDAILDIASNLKTYGIAKKSKIA